MLKALSFGLGVGAAVQAWRAWPAQSLVTADSLALVFCVGLVASYFAGKLAGRGRSVSATATATAVSTAQANQSVQVAFIVPGQGPGAVPGGVQVPTEAAQWFDSTSTRPQLTADDLDGMDLGDLLEEHSEGHES
jgi:hypothetical protein